jgi:hypothetical protein
MTLAYWFLAELISSTLKMEAIYSSETSVETQRTTRRHIPEDDTLHNYRCENLKSYILAEVSLQENAGTVPGLGHDHFLPNNFQLFNHRSSYQPTLSSLRD